MSSPREGNDSLLACPLSLFGLGIVRDLPRIVEAFVRGFSSERGEVREIARERVARGFNGVGRFLGFSMTGRLFSLVSAGRGAFVPGVYPGGALTGYRHICCAKFQRNRTIRGRVITI